MKRKNTLLLLQVAAAMACGHSDKFYSDLERTHTSTPDSDAKDTPPDKPATLSLKSHESRQLREFSIKGHKVMAYSKKDAITRLKHQKKI